MKIYQEDREKEILAKKSEKAKLMELDTQFIKDIFNLILTDSKNHQKEIIHPTYYQKRIQIIQDTKTK